MASDWKSHQLRYVKLRGWGFDFWGCLFLNDCSNCYDLSLTVRSTFPAPVEIALSLFWKPVLWMSVTCVVLWQQLRLVTWWAMVESSFSHLQSRMRGGIWAPKPHSCQQRQYPSDQKQTFWWLLVKKFSRFFFLPRKAAFLSYIGTFSVQQHPKKTRHFQDQFWSLVSNLAEILY